ncbi:programmed cell death protein 2-like [Dipodomys spectabilis]|uniref:programmed cell death protein 2-like n=1 Tax=Dipodomys spectabilis TaxID=105255 RepID=UPI001C53A93B|nr:programmed cell death protein 2-like [Dipodomys spectabilis]
MAAVRKPPVLLGLRDAAVRDGLTGPSAWTASKLGGVADALPAVAAPRPACARCGRPLALVVQLYCPLEGSPFHRLLHVFACAQPTCADGGWKVLRSQCLQVREKEAAEAQKQESGLAAESWCEGADDWGGDGEETPAPQLPLDFGKDSYCAKDADCTVQLQGLCLKDTGVDAACPASQHRGMAVPTGVPQFQPFYICVVDEEDFRDLVSLDHAYNLLRDYEQREGIHMDQLLSQSFSDAGDEKYEKTKIKSGDQMFYKFMKRIAACQDQILRYSWSGEPLFLSCPTSGITEVPACGHCGGPRTFECQLMPALVTMLNSAHLGLCVEFGTVLVYTCEKSCWPQNHQTPMEEFCIIQQDPDEFLFK